VLPPQAMEETPAFHRRFDTTAKLPVTSGHTASCRDEDLLRTATASSQRNQSVIPLILFPIGFIVMGICLCVMAWLAFHGPILVPGQDTRITAIIISFGSRLVGFFVGAALVRSAWAAFLPQVVAGESIPTLALVGVCRKFMSLGQLENYSSLPLSFRIHIAVAAFTSLAIMGTSASFRYVVLGLPTQGVAMVPDVASLCNATLVNSTGYFCSGKLNANTTDESWSYLDQVYSGGQATVHQHGKLGDQELGANVTLAALPPGWTLDKGNNLPWMEMSVTCRNLSISADFTGVNESATSIIYVNNTELDVLDISNMPDWGSVVHLYQQVNESGPASSLCPWIVVMLSRDLNDDTANFGGLAPDAVVYLGASYLDLHGYGPTRQGVLGAAAWCEFQGSTGGQWPDELWPPLNHTSNVVIGEVIDDRPTMGTAMLNYGPSWQYNPLSGNSLPGGSVSYIANNTGRGVDFPALFTSYIRNQWTLMAYSIAPQSGPRVSLYFTGLGTDKLYISLTFVSILPFLALAVGLLVTARAWICTIRRRRWVNRVEFESWWLAKALRPDMYESGYCNATEKDFSNACKCSSAAYRDIYPDRDVGHLILCALGPNEMATGSCISTDSRQPRVYG
jgi:hypothetical protein